MGCEKRTLLYNILYCYVYSCIIFRHRGHLQLLVEQKHARVHQ
jgi:hypothetical protein